MSVFDFERPICLAHVKRVGLKMSCSDFQALLKSLSLKEPKFLGH